MAEWAHKREQEFIEDAVLQNFYFSANYFIFDFPVGLFDGFHLNGPNEFAPENLEKTRCVIANS